MYTASENICVALTIASPALLLVARLVSPSRFPWWLILVVTATTSTILGVALDHLGWYAHNERTTACFEDMAQVSSEPGCSVSYHVWTLPWFLKWIGGAVIFVACLPLYGLAVWLRKHMPHILRAPNKLLHATRETRAPEQWRSAKKREGNK
jgi:hypothetical protein